MNGASPKKGNDSNGGGGKTSSYKEGGPKLTRSASSDSFCLEPKDTFHTSSKLSKAHPSTPPPPRSASKYQQVQQHDNGNVRPGGMFSRSASLDRQPVRSSCEDGSSLDRPPPTTTLKTPPKSKPEETDPTEITPLVTSLDKSFDCLTTGETISGSVYGRPSSNTSDLTEGTKQSIDTSEMETSSPTSLGSKF